ncbi:MAG: hypothetical protein JSV13_03060 [Nitrospiraceae bacterium]|nr:MAG: hypothetical protein JSV13_03060 [Nitrospiraceae bacterium]
MPADLNSISYTQQADENLRQQMEALKLVFYVNKGSDPDPVKLASRLEYLVGYIIEKFS